MQDILLSQKLTCIMLKIFISYHHVSVQDSEHVILTKVIDFYEVWDGGELTLIRTYGRIVESLVQPISTMALPLYGTKALASMVYIHCKPYISAVPY